MQKELTLGWKRKMRSLKQAEANLTNLLRQEMLPKIKEDLQKQYEEEQQRKKKSTRLGRLIKRVFGK